MSRVTINGETVSILREDYCKLGEEAARLKVTIDELAAKRLAKAKPKKTKKGEG